MVEEIKHDCEWYKEQMPKYVKRDSSLTESDCNEIDSHLGTFCSECMKHYAIWLQVNALERGR